MTYLAQSGVCAVTDLHEQIDTLDIHPRDLDATSLAVCAKLAGISEGHLRNLVAAGDGPIVNTMHGRIVVTRANRIAWLQSHPRK